MPEPEIPSSRELRWPILLELDVIREEDDLIAFRDRIERRLGLPEGIDKVVNPKTGQSVLTERLVRAVRDLHAAGAVDADEHGGHVWITDEGQRLSEAEVEALPLSEDRHEDPPEKPSVGDWLVALFYSFVTGGRG